jgi:hypothetical protein
VHGNRIAFLEPPRGGWWEADAWGNCRPFQFESTSGNRYQSESTGDAFRAEYVPGDGLVSWPTPLGVTPAVCRRLPFQPRLFRIIRLVSVLRVARVARGLRLVRVLSGLNRGMRARGATLRRRGFGYVLALTVVVTLLGAAGMCAFESDPRGGRGPHDYGTALWWTAMVMTTISTGLRRTPLTYPAFFRPTGRLP